MTIDAEAATPSTLSGVTSASLDDSSGNPSTSITDMKLEMVAPLWAFTCFQELPYELRRNIWNQAREVTRIVDIWGYAIDAERCEVFTTQILEETAYAYKTNRHGIPAILHTSFEAREVGLEHYKLSFAPNMIGYIRNKIATIPVISQGKIYFNANYDIAIPKGVFDDGARHRRDSASLFKTYFITSLIHSQHGFFKVRVSINEEYERFRSICDRDIPAGHLHIYCSYLCHESPGIAEIVLYLDETEKLSHGFHSLLRKFGLIERQDWAARSLPAAGKDRVL